MALFNYATKEITLKIVYYGPGLSGKTTNLQQLYSILDPSKKGKFLSLSTETDRTLFFDFLPVDIGKIKDFSIRFQLYTVPGQVKYNATRKVVLRGADAIVFVADSQREMGEANLESFANMRDNLIENNINPDDIPILLQYNKRDLPDILSIDELNKDLNSAGQVYLEAEAVNGKGVHDTFQVITKLLIKDIAQKHKLEVQPPQPAPPPEELILPAAEPVKEYLFEEEIPVEQPITTAYEEEPIEILETKEITPIEETVWPTFLPIQESPAEATEISEERQSVEPIFFEEPLEEEKIIIPESKIEIERAEQNVLEKPAIKEIPAFPIEKLDNIADGIKEINKLIIGIIEKDEKGIRKESSIKEPAYTAEKTDKITESLKETNQLLINVKAAIKELSDEFKKSKEDQKEILTIIRGIKISEAVERIKSKEKEKKGWFGLK